jgi:hypothetical protein
LYYLDSFAVTISESPDDDDEERDEEGIEVRGLVYIGRSFHHVLSKQDETNVLTLDIDSHGKIYAKSQVIDYIARGDELSDLNMLDYFVDTYEADLTNQIESDDEDLSEEDEGSAAENDMEK